MSGVEFTADMASLRERLQVAREAIFHRFDQGADAAVLVRELAQCTDVVLIDAFSRSRLDNDVALVAVGGYGRGELHPWSDIDLLLVTVERPSEGCLERVRSFVAGLWDLGLEIGHSVRSPSECGARARADISIATAVMESRLVAGVEPLFHRMRELSVGQRTWSSQAFLRAKLDEQRARYARFDNSGYKLEPNVKESPGGLRDLQVVTWVAMHHFQARSLEDLNHLGFLTDAEYNDLLAGRNFLWKVRFDLHLRAKRREDRLLFDTQRAMARRFGLIDDDANLAVEQFMKRYYRTVMELSRLNEMLLELLHEAILVEPAELETKSINPRFRAVAGFLEVSDPSVFAQQPWTLLELFLVMQQNPTLKGVRAGTIRLVRAHCHRLDHRIRSDIRARSTFVDILRQPRGVTREFSRMHRYGVLERYLPVFGQVAGQMQFDLFHVYTVDEHSLRVLGNVRAFAVEERAKEFPLCSSIFARLPKPELLYIAGLFHDIAKGRGGDHSELGAVDAEQFCTDHGFSDYDGRLVAWLVRHHLLMSTTSQRQDISDPDVVRSFASRIGDQTHLDYLYLLTVADIRGTNPQLWNDWRASLLRELYSTTSRALRTGLENPIDRGVLIAQTQTQARMVLKLLDPSLPDRAQALWHTLGDDYFLRSSADEIAWHAQSLIGDDSDILNPPVVLLRNGRFGSEIFVYAEDQRFLFAALCTILDRLNLSVVEARIITAQNGMTLDTFVVQDNHGDAVLDGMRVHEIQHTLREGLRHPEQVRGGSKRMARRELRAFSTPVRVQGMSDPHNDRSVIELVAGDRPGLLARIGWVLADAGVQLQTAKISTFGERAEDVFFVTDNDNHALDGDTIAAVEQALVAALSEP